MFDTLVAQLSSRSLTVTRREQGVAFFGVAKDLYQLADLTYFCANIPIMARAKHYAHCVYSDSAVRHYMSQHRIDFDFTAATGFTNGLGFCHAPMNSDAGDDGPHPASLLKEEVGPENQFTLTFPLRQRHGEVAIFAVSAGMESFRVAGAKKNTHQRMPNSRKLFS